MERVAAKLKRDLPLDVDELTVWANYNFLVLPEDDQDMLRDYVRRESRINLYTSLVLPVFAYGSYAIVKYSLKRNLATNLFVTGGLTFSFFKAFYVGYRRDKFKDL